MRDINGFTDGSDRDTVRLRPAIQSDAEESGNVFSEIECYTGDEPYIFISYSHEDKELKTILNGLRENGFRFWFDGGIESGSKWRREIADRINRCAVMLAFMSRNAILSNNVKNELFYADDKEKKIIMVYLDDARLDDELHLQFGRNQHIFRKNYSSFDVFLKKILSSIDQRTSKKTTPRRKPTAI